MQGEKNWANMSTKELQEAAKDNHDRPLGTFMGDYHVKGKEGPEEAVSRSNLPVPAKEPELTISKTIAVRRERKPFREQQSSPSGER